MADNDYGWNQFNSDFSIPASDDAARVFHEAKASLETWIKNGLEDIHEKMTSHLQGGLDDLTQKLDESKKVTLSAQARIDQLNHEIQQLNPKDEKLQESVD